MTATEFVRQRRIFDALSQRLKLTIRQNRMVSDHFIFSLDGLYGLEIEKIYDEVFYRRPIAVTLKDKMSEWSIQATADIRFETLLAIIRLEIEKL